MKKLIFSLAILFTSLVSIAQPTGYLGMRLYGPTMTNQWFVYNSPGITFSTSKLVAEFRDSTYAKWYYGAFQITYLASSTPTYVRPNSSGILEKAPITDIFNPSNYYDKIASDSRYLQSFSEADPVFVTDSIMYARKTYVYSRSESDSRYLQGFTELDPVFSASSAFGITGLMISNWNSAFSWGPHSGLYPLLSGSYSNPTWISSLDHSKIIYSGTNLQYIRGDGSLATFPSVGSGTVTSVNSSNGSATVLNTTTTPVITINDAPKLTTARNINGQPFDGTTNITIPGSAITSIPNSSLSNSSVTINGSAVSLGGSVNVTASPVIGAPASGNSITMGTAFQPRSGGPCMISVNTSLTGVLGLNETITVALSATQNGTYTTVTTDVLLIGVLGLTLDRSVGTIPVPSGWWVRVTRSGTASSATYTKWDL